MKNDIILAGVGGQGILSIAACIGLAAVENNLFLKQAEVHGMSQRGGDVQSHLRISDRPVASDLIPQGSADMIISVEPMESLRHLPMLSETGWLVTSAEPFINIADYPPVEKILGEIVNSGNHIIIDAERIAREAGSVRAANMVILGAATPFIDIPYGSIKNAVKNLFRKKGEDIVKINLDAVGLGREFSLNKL